MLTAKKRLFAFVTVFVRNVNIFATIGQPEGAAVKWR